MKSEGLLGSGELRVDNPFEEVSFMGKEDDGRWRPMWGQGTFLLFLREERFKED